MMQKEGVAVIDLRAKSPCDGLLPLTVGGVTVSEVDAGCMTSLAPYKGQEEALSEALKAAHGMGLPAPNRATGKDGARAIWFGNRMALLIGPAPDTTLAQHAALTDQSDGWTVVRLEGARARDVLARLTPIDLRPGTFKRGHSARTELAHMMGSVTRLGEDTYLLMVFRAFAGTLVHDLQTAMETVSAR